MFPIAITKAKEFYTFQIFIEPLASPVARNLLSGLKAIAVSLNYNFTG